MSYTASATETYSVADIEIVMRRVTADLIMIADSSKAITRQKAQEYGHDIEVLAKSGYLKSVDVTLFSGAVEERALLYEVNTTSGQLTASRPGGVLWPEVTQPFLQITISHTSDYNDTARAKLAPKLKIGWVPSNADTTHSTLMSSGERNYASNGYGMERKGFTR